MPVMAWLVVFGQKPSPLKFIARKWQEGNIFEAFHAWLSSATPMTP
jgi:hypothetical protein